MNAFQLITVSIFLAVLSTGCSENDSTSPAQVETTSGSIPVNTPPTPDPQQVWEGSLFLTGDNGQTVAEYPVKLTTTKNSETSYTDVYEEDYDGNISVTTCERKITFFGGDQREVETKCPGHLQYSNCFGSLCSGQFTNASIGDTDEVFLLSELIENDRMTTFYNLYEGENVSGIPGVYGIIYQLNKK